MAAEGVGRRTDRGHREERHDGDQGEQEGPRPNGQSATTASGSERRGDPGGPDRLPRAAPSAPARSRARSSGSGEVGVAPPRMQAGAQAWLP